MMYTHCYDLPLVGGVSLVEEDGRILALDLIRKDGGRKSGPLAANAADEETPLLREAGRQLKAYLTGRLRDFDLPLAPQGTPFQQKVWAALTAIPYGETRSYKQVAEAVDCPKGCRAVGMANNRNPIAIVIPCHRVIGADGAGGPRRRPAHQGMPAPEKALIHAPARLLPDCRKLPLRAGCIYGISLWHLECPQ
ncbi:MAG: methylated-DNA--[protein]-cysteine S-methyltransferase [Desulfovibrio fairfieldensis]